MILSAIGVPVEYIAVYIGIDRFLDMARSSLNVTGDIFTTLIVDKTSGELDKKVYDSSENPDVFQIQNEQERASDLV
jgi:Na+/H+-dicarboxylate symporter